MDIRKGESGGILRGGREGPTEEEKTPKRKTQAANL